MTENFHASGTFTKQAHVKIPAGTFEEEHARKGFFGRVSQLYHNNKPTDWVQIDGDMKPRNLPPLFEDKALHNKFVKMLYNTDLEIYLGTITENPKSFYRNGDFDEMFFIHEGEGRLETIYGHIPFKKGDYILVPRGTTYKTYIDQPCKILKVESNSEFEEPSRGILGPNALYDQTAKFIPEAALGSENNLKEYPVDVKHHGKITRVTYPFNPLDAVGWKGSLYPWRISIYVLLSHQFSSLSYSPIRTYDVCCFKIL